MTDEPKAAPGRPVKHGKTRVRWRHVIRETRKTNRDAVAQLAASEIALKAKVVRSHAIANVVRGVIVGMAFAAVLIARCGL